MDDLQLGISQRFFISKNGLGYNFELADSNALIYFHNVNNRVFNKKDKYLLSFKPSLRAPGRLDAETVDKVKEFADAIDVCWPNEEKRKLLFQ